MAVFQDVENPRRSNATRHDLGEMPAIALPSMPGGGSACVDMSGYAHVAEPFPRRFMKLGHGAPSHDAFSDLFKSERPTHTSLSNIAA